MPMNPGASSATGIPPRSRRFYRDVYNGIVTSTNNLDSYVVALVDAMQSMSDAGALADVYSPAERSRVKHAIYQVGFTMVMGELKAKPDTDPSRRFLLREFYDAVELFGTPEDGAPYDDLLFFALLCVALDKHREAFETFQKIVAIQPDNEYAQLAADTASDFMAFPRFRYPYMIRCKDAWNAFQNILKDPWMGPADSDLGQNNILKCFQLWTGLTVFAGPGSNGQNKLLFSPFNWEVDFYPTQKAIQVGLDSLPEGLKTRWSIELGCTPWEDIPLPDKTRFNVLDVETVVEETEDEDGVYLKLYHPLTAPYASSPMLEIILARAVASVLNAPDFCVIIRSMEILSEKPEHCTGTIRTLPEQLDALNYLLEHTEQDIEEIRLYQAYTREPKKGVGLRLREDISQGESACVWLQEEYDSSQTDAVDHFMNCGIAPVFLCWPRKIMDCDEEQFTQRIVDVLSAEGVAGSLKIIGKASGNRYCYLDLLLWDTYPMVDAIEAHFSQIPGGDAVRIQSFYPDAYPCPVARIYLKDRPGISVAGLSSQADSNFDISKASHPQKNTKKKNAAKAKRKHSKKYR